MSKVDYDVMNMEVSEISPRIEDWSLTIFSPAGKGKTTLVHNMFKEKVVFLRFEKGTKAIRTKGIDVNGDFQNVLDFTTQCERAYKKNGFLPFGVICWDTMDVCSDDVTNYIIQSEGEEVFTKEKNNSGYAMARKAVSEVVKRLEALGLYNIFLVHYAEKNVKRKLVESYDEGQMSVSGTFQKVCYDLVDLCGVIIEEKIGDESVRRLYFRHQDYGVKTRLTCMPDFIDLGKSAEEGAKNFLKAFQKAVEDEAKLDSNFIADEPAKPVTPSVVPPKPSTEDKKPSVVADDEDNDEEETDSRLPMLQKKVADYYTSELNAGRITSKGELRDKMQEEFGVRKSSDIKDVNKMMNFLGRISMDSEEE